ncbi:conserved hypothetical protein [Histoplasma capsulatum H143]|uniref:Uncharacterized protein n=1 Tax=Ajellomyces capsulatus (strain H143) TaxID=544712 RepID=C6H836_AJECH|nr:conserved hypothetical protein [Histoplasma capsulatum H143]
MIESPLHKLKVSIDGILKKLKTTIIESQLWHDLQISKVFDNDEILTSQEGVHSLNVVFEFQQKSEQSSQCKPPRMPYVLINTGSSIVDPPPTVLRIFLHNISIFFSFSSTSSNNIPEGSFGDIPSSNSSEDLSSMLQPQGGSQDEMGCGRDDISIGGSQMTAWSDDDWMSLDYVSPSCSQQTSYHCRCGAISSLQTEPLEVPEATYQPFMKLLNSGFHTSLCRTNRRSTSDITTIIEIPGPSLQEFAPSLFVPGYDDNVLQRARFIPMISKGIAAMLDNVPRPNAGAQLERAVIGSICSERKFESSGTSNDFTHTKNTKSALKTLLWKSMQRRLFTPEAARQLPSVITPLKLKNNGPSQNTIPAISLAHTTTIITGLINDQSPHADRISDTEWCFAEDSDILLTDELDSENGDRNTYFTNLFQIQHPYCMGVTNPNYDGERDLPDNPNTTGKPSPSPPPITSSIHDDLDMLDDREQETTLITDIPDFPLLQITKSRPSSMSLTPVIRNTTTTTATATSKALISIPPSPPSSEMEILDPSSPVTIPEEFLLSLSSTHHGPHATIATAQASNFVDEILPKYFSPNESYGRSLGGGGGGDGCGTGDSEMLLL